MRRLTLMLLPVGPLCVALVRYLLPYYTASTNAATARSVLTHPGRESAVLWLSVAALLTLLPGLVTVATTLPPTRYRTCAFAFLVPGYLCLGALICEDSTMWSAARAHLGEHAMAALLAHTHPAIVAATMIFVVGHVVGTVLLGVALLRTSGLPAWIGYVVAISQPLHALAFIVLGSPLLDLLGYVLLAAGLAGVARALIQRDTTGSQRTQPIPTARRAPSAAT